MSWFTPKRPERILILSEKPFDNESLVRIIASRPDNDPFWRAVLQLIGQAEHEAGIGAQENVTNHASCAAYLGTEEGMRLLRDRLFEFKNAKPAS